MGFGTTAQQVGLMFVFILLGLFGAHKKWIGDQAVVGMTNIMVYFVTPAVILQAFNRPFDIGKLGELGIVAAVCLVAFPVMIGLVWLLYAKVRDPDRRRDLRFGGIYSNAGYLGIPLVQALYGSDGVFFTVLFVVAFNIFVWTQGWAMFPSTTGGPLKQLFKNPAIPSVILGLLLFVFSVNLPSIVTEGLGYLAGLNAPLAMLIVGATLAKVNWRTFATDPWVWVGTAVRNVLIPLIAVLVLWAVPLSQTAKAAILIPIACPVAAFLVMFTVLHEMRPDFASRLVCVSTLACIVTLPATVSLAYALW